MRADHRVQKDLASDTEIPVSGRAYWVEMPAGVVWIDRIVRTLTKALIGINMFLNMINSTRGHGLKVFIVVASF